jgi:hypothetical protein
MEKLAPIIYVIVVNFIISILYAVLKIFLFYIFGWNFHSSENISWMSISIMNVLVSTNLNMNIGYFTVLGMCRIQIPVSGKI